MHVPRIFSLVASALVLAIASWTVVAAPVVDTAARVGAKPVQDEQGRTLYYIDLERDAFARMPQELPTAVDRARFAQGNHTDEAIGAVNALEKRLGFEHRVITSTINNGFSAYLTDKQLQQLLKLPFVETITEATRAEWSSYFAPWADKSLPSTSGFNETMSWGRQAVNGGSFTTPPGTRPRVYVLDGGVVSHADLPNVARVSLTYADVNGVGTAVPVWGCDSHATHVAGIIGAEAGNRGVMGVAAGADLISVSLSDHILQDPNTHEILCGWNYQVGAPTDMIVAGLDFVMRDLTNNPNTAVVNISLSGAAFAQGTVANKMYALTQRTTTFPGAMVVQAAGNHSTDACNGWAYSATRPDDGILVVGGIDRFMNPMGAVTEFGADPNLEPGTNFGPCVEVYAPGYKIVSTWGTPGRFTPPCYDETFCNPVDLSKPHNISGTYDNYETITGTSMAAPHIAGVAAMLLRDNRTMTPSALEAAIRARMWTLPGQIGGRSVQTVTLLDTAEDSDGDGIPNYVEYQEGRNPLVRDNDVNGSNRWFVQQVYRDFEETEASPGALYYWPQQLQSGSTTRAQYVITEFTNAPAIASFPLVARSMWAAYNRIPDYSTTRFWVNYMQYINADTLGDALYGTAEAQALWAGMSHAQFVNAMYTNNLGRAPTADESNYLVQQLTSYQMTRGKVISLVAQSQESVSFRSNQVFTLGMYTYLFRRTADSGGFNYWSNAIATGTPRTTLVDAFLGWYEYTNRFY